MGHGTTVAWPRATNRPIQQRHVAGAAYLLQAQHNKHRPIDAPLHSSDLMPAIFSHCFEVHGSDLVTLDARQHPQTCPWGFTPAAHVQQAPWVHQQWLPRDVGAGVPGTARSRQQTAAETTFQVPRHQDLRGRQGHMCTNTVFSWSFSLQLTSRGTMTTAHHAAGNQQNCCESDQREGCSTRRAVSSATKCAFKAWPCRQAAKLHRMAPTVRDDAAVPRRLHDSCQHVL